MISISLPVQAELASLPIQQQVSVVSRLMRGHRRSVRHVQTPQPFGIGVALSPAK
jgi:hypothetical protein